MGRVYKALSKSWKENAHKEPPKAAPAFERPKSTGASSDEEPVAWRPEVRREVKASPVVTARERVVEFYNPVNAPTLDVENALMSFRDLALGEDFSLPKTQVEELPAPVFEEPNEVRQIADLTVEPRLVTLTNTEATACERYRTLAVRLLNLASGRQQSIKTILVTSARPGEGKSTIVTNLAWVMAKSAAGRVLLIDGNAQQPSVCDKLGVTTRHGWLDVVDENAKFVDAAVCLEPNRLYVMSPGKSGDGAAAGNQSDSITSSRVEKLFKEFAQHFEFILVDTAAILDSADTQRLASLVDGAILVTRAGHTPHAAVTEALKLVPKEKRLGIVLNESEGDGKTNSGKSGRREVA